MTCENESQICCHRTALKTVEEEIETPSEVYDDYSDTVPCSSVAKVGYR